MITIILGIGATLGWLVAFVMYSRLRRMARALLKAVAMMRDLNGRNLQLASTLIDATKWMMARHAFGDPYGDDGEAMLRHMLATLDENHQPNREVFLQ